MALALALAGPASASPGASWSPAERTAMREGQLVVHDLPADEGGALQAGFFVAAPAAVARAVLWDHERFPEFMPDMKSTRVLERHGNRHVVEQTGGKGPFKVTFVTERLLEPDGVAWRTLRGDVKRNDGYWAFAPAPGGSFVTYEVHVATYQPVPGGVVAYLQKQALPAMIQAVKRRIEATARG
jgi:ribosome-associated toxin RatA of RatAB toxin-antitoxin module